MNVHVHALIPDGTFVREDGVVHFEGLGAPTDDELLDIVRRIAVRVKKALRATTRSTSSSLSTEPASCPL